MPDTRWPLARTRSWPLPPGPTSDDHLARARRDLAEHTLPASFDARAYWTSLPLSREQLAHFVGDARVFSHVRDGGSTIISRLDEQSRFVEAFYQTVMPCFGDAEWDIVAAALPPIDDQLIALNQYPLRVQQVLRLAAASGRFDDQIMWAIEASRRFAFPLFPVLHAMRDPSVFATLAPRSYTLNNPLAIEKWIDRFGDTRLDFVEQSLRSIHSTRDMTPLWAKLVELLPAASLMPLAESLRATGGGRAIEKWLAAEARAAKRKRNV